MKLETCNKEQRSRGFTILEMVIVIAMLAVLATIVLFSFRGYDTKQNVETAANEVVALLADARGKTLAGLDDSAYGVRFDIGSVILFKGAAYDADDPANEEVVLTDVLITDVDFGSGSEVVFERLTGATDDAGTATIVSLTDATRSATVTVEPTGLAQYVLE